MLLTSPLSHGTVNGDPLVPYCRQLNTLGEDKDWLNDSRVFGNYNVAYVSSGPSQRGNPAGGRWRGRLGRSLFR